MSALSAAAAERPENEQTEEGGRDEPLGCHERDDAEGKLIQERDPRQDPRETREEAHAGGHEQRTTPHMGPSAKTLAKCGAHTDAIRDTHRRTSEHEGWALATPLPAPRESQLI